MDRITMKPKTQIDKRIRRGRPGSNMERARELMATGWSGTKEDMAERLGITEAQARKVIACVLREERGMKIPESVTIAGHAHKILPSTAIKERGLVPITRPLSLSDPSLSNIALDFRGSGLPIYAVNATPNKCHHLQIMLCRDKPSSRKNAAHAIPKKHSYKVLRNQPKSQTQPI